MFDFSLSLEQESLGACTYWLASLHYLFPFPSAPAFIRGHLHASACGVGGIIGGSSEQQNLFSAFTADALRASVGMGLVAGLPGTGRMTLTVSKILAQQSNDYTTPYIQLGISASFD
jgi:outer membrane protein assembly factor BamA